MNDNKEDRSVFLSINYQDGEGKQANTSQEYDNYVPWTKLLNDFVDFLGYVYGYSIKDKVALRVTDTPLFFPDPDYDRWSGPYFYKDADQEDKEAQEAEWAQKFDKAQRQYEESGQMDLFEEPRTDRWCDPNSAGYKPGLTD